MLSRYTTRKRASEESQTLETPIVWRNTSDTFTPRGLGYHCSSCELGSCLSVDRLSLLRKYLKRDPKIVRSRQTVLETH